VSAAVGRAAIGALLALAGATGCSTAPRDLAGDYALTRVDGVALPYLYLATAMCDRYLQRGALRLMPDGRFHLDIATREDCTPAGGAMTDDSVRYEGSWLLADSLWLVSQRPSAQFAGVAVRPDLLVLYSDDLLPGLRGYRFGTGALPGER
jgi:hypothetical protein